MELNEPIEAKQCYKYTALYIAALHGHKAIVKTLLENQAHIEARDQWKFTPLHAAV